MGDPSARAFEVFLIVSQEYFDRGAKGGNSGSFWGGFSSFTFLPRWEVFSRRRRHRVRRREKRSSLDDDDDDEDEEEEDEEEKKKEMRHRP